MPTVGKRRRNVQSPLKTSQTENLSHDNQNESQKICQYEESREKRIRENLERMEKLGILDLSLKLKSSTVQRRASRNRWDRKTPQHPLPGSVPAGPVRRSSRLQNATPVSYSEVKEQSIRNEDVVLEAGSKPEVYTEEHEKLLGDTGRSWAFFVDGYAKDGKRIYDPVKGKTCHQCRQKTLGYRTQCSKCGLVQGQFCGDCLYMRYGEHVLEAIQNPNWICPVCRGICNCSLCRQAKGWPPTGVIYRKISQMGYKSVAHYLIQTKRSDAVTAKPVDPTAQLSVKRSLPFSDTSAMLEGSLLVNEKHMRPEGVGDHGETCISDDQGSVCQVSVRRSLPFFNTKAVSEKQELVDVAKGVLDKIDGQFDCDTAPKSRVSDLKLETVSVNNNNHISTCENLTQILEMDMKRGSDLQGQKAETGDNKEEYIEESKQCNDLLALKTNSKLKDSAQTVERNLDSIAGRLKQRRKSEAGSEKLISLNNKTSVSDCKHEINISENKKTQVSLADEATGSAKRSSDGIAGRLRPRCERT